MSIRVQPILLAEDDPDDALLFQRALARADIRNPLVVVGDGDEVVEYLSGTGRFADHGRNPLPAILLLDLKMPRRDGFEVLAWLRGRPGLAGLPVVCLTSSRQPADIRRAYELGAASYLVKPGSPEALLEIVRGLGLYWLLLNERPDMSR